MVDSTRFFFFQFRTWLCQSKEDYDFWLSVPYGRQKNICNPYTSRRSLKLKYKVIERCLLLEPFTIFLTPYDCFDWWQQTFCYIILGAQSGATIHFARSYKHMTIWHSVCARRPGDLSMFRNKTWFFIFFSFSCRFSPSCMTENAHAKWLWE